MLILAHSRTVIRTISIISTDRLRSNQHRKDRLCMNVLQYMKDLLCRKDHQFKIDQWNRHRRLRNSILLNVRLRHHPINRKNSIQTINNTVLPMPAQKLLVE